MTRKIYLSLLAIVLTVSPVFSQVLNDGPIELSVRLRRILITLPQPSDLSLQVGSLNTGSFGTDEYTIGLQAAPDSDITNIGFQGPTCLTPDLAPPGFTPDYNQILFSETYTGANVPQYFDLSIDAWEDDTPDDFDLVSGLTPCADNTDRCTYENSTCCVNLPIVGCVFDEGDDERCNEPIFVDNLDYRAAGPPCVWSAHTGYTTNCGNNDIYQPEIESFWRYTKGTACTPNDAIDLGTLTPGGSFSHFNNTECYSNNFASSAGKDVFYTFEITSALGVDISLCGSNTTFDTYLYLLNSACTVDTSNDNSCSVQSQISKALCVPGRYYVVVDGASASEEGTFELVISENTNFTFSASTTTVDASCNGVADGEATATANGGVPPYTYAWPGGGSMATETGLGAGSYTVTVSDAEGCSATSTAVVGEPDPLVVTTSTTNVSCGGVSDGSATANVTGGTVPYSYIWTSNPPQTGQTAVLLGAGTYNVTISDVNGCSTNSSATITQSTTIVLTVDNVNDVSCFGLNDGAIGISVAGGNTPYVYAWSNSATTEDISGIGPGTYSVTVTDADGCFEDTSFTILEPTLLTSTINQTIDVSCFGGSDGAVDLGVGGGTPLYTYAWSDGSTGEELLNATAGSYTVTITDAGGCTSTNSATVAEPAAITSSVAGTDEGCDGSNDGAADLTVSGGAGSFSYFWSNLATTEDISSLSAGSFTVVITDANNCTRVDSVTINSLGSFSLSATITNATCQGDEDGAVDLSVNGGATPYTFAWSNGITTEDLAAITSGAYEVTVTDNNTCSEVGIYFVDLSGTIEDCVPTVTPLNENYVAIPNVFSPNGDIVNDIFEFHINNTDIVEVKIFDRVGQLVYTNPNQATNDGWDGTFKGDDAQEGTYVYLVNVTYTDGVEEQLTGSVTLIR